MPLYEYACERCEHHFEALVFGAEKVVCPECQSGKVEKQLSMPAKPRGESSALPMQCNPKAPPCGPACCRL